MRGFGRESLEPRGPKGLPIITLGCRNLAGWLANEVQHRIFTIGFVPQNKNIRFVPQSINKRFVPQNARTKH